MVDDEESLRVCYELGRRWIDAHLTWVETSDSWSVASDRVRRSNASTRDELQRDFEQIKHIHDESLRFVTEVEVEFLNALASLRDPLGTYREVRTQWIDELVFSRDEDNDPHALRLFYEAWSSSQNAHSVMFHLGGRSYGTGLEADKTRQEYDEAVLVYRETVVRRESARKSLKDPDRAELDARRRWHCELIFNRGEDKVRARLAIRPRPWWRFFVTKWIAIAKNILLIFILPFSVLAGISVWFGYFIGAVWDGLGLFGGWWVYPIAFVLTMGRVHFLLMIPAFYGARDLWGWDWHYAALLISPGIIWLLFVCLTFAGILSVISVQEIWRWWRRPRE